MEAANERYAAPDDERRLLLLGPQPHYRSLREAVRRLELDGPAAVITAGWEEDELEPRLTGPLMEALPEGSFNLELFRRSEELFAADPELIAMLRDRQDELRLLRDAYRIRLELALDAVLKLEQTGDSRVDLSAERESAMEMVRLLDRQYFLRTCQICDGWEERLQTPSRPEVVRHRAEIRDRMGEATAIVASGGHAAIILNRLRIFGITEMEPELPVIAWSGAAMALAEQIVFFHDHLPQGRGEAEVLRAGIGVYHEWLPLPDARNRLRLDDAGNVSRFARRFDAWQCIVLDEQTMLDRNAGQWNVSGDAMRLDASGQLVPANGMVAA
jgi:hypothetical protein